jgi:hypothetical protein
VSKRRNGLIAAVLLVAMLGGVVVLARADAGGTTGLGFDDPYTQIVNHEIPVQPDGKPTYFDGGRHYIGPNGWEIRLNHKRTMTIVAVEHIVVVQGAGAVAGTALATAAAALAPETVLGGAIVSAVDSSAFKIAASFAGNLFDQFKVSPAIDDAFKNRCIGITIPKNALPHLFLRVNLLLNGKFVQFFDEPRYDDAKMWFENCAPDDKSQADIVQTPPPPATQPGDTALATPALPVPKPPAQQPKPTPPAPAPPTNTPAPPKVAPPPPAAHQPIYQDVSMTRVCQRQFGGGYVDSYTNQNDPNSWVCTGPGGDVRTDLRVQEFACDIDLPGSKAQIVPDDQIPAYQWKCVK